MIRYSQKSISVVIPNYNGSDLLQRNIPSIYVALQKAGVSYEVIIVDDASTDDSVSMLKEKFEEIIILVNKKNSGFSPTINRGIKIAKNELVLLLNSDVFLLPEYFNHLFKYFDKENTFGVSGRFIGLNDEKIQEAAKYPQLSPSKKISPYNFYVENSSSWIPTLYLCGGGALIDKEKLQRLQGFDEIYAPFYMEDTDLSIRAWRAGWRCYYEHEAVCMHPASTTIKKFHKKRRVWVTTQRNKLILHSLHLSNPSKLIWNVRQAVTLVAQALVCRWKYHEAFFKYLGKRHEIKLSNQRQLEIYNGNPHSVESIMAIMRTEIDQHEITKI
jgi:GT2 family glycosyltransferase